MLRQGSILKLAIYTVSINKKIREDLKNKKIKMNRHTVNGSGKKKLKCSCAQAPHCISREDKIFCGVLCHLFAEGEETQG